VKDIAGCQPIWLIHSNRAVLSITRVSKATSAMAVARDWLAVFHLPPCASELSPVESVRSHLKRSLANLVKRDIAQFTALGKNQLQRM
jgi:transposase